MSIVDLLKTPGWPHQRMGNLFHRVQDTGHSDLQALSVFLGDGVVPRSSREDNFNQLGLDLDKYQRVSPGDIVFNKLRTWQGGFGVSHHTGIVSPAYIVCRPRVSSVESRFFHHLLRSEPYLAELTRLSKWMPPSQFDIAWHDIRGMEIAAPAIDEQRRIADFLDDQVDRIDSIIAVRGAQSALIDQSKLDLALATLIGKDGVHVSRRPVGISWLQDIPVDWMMTTVHSAYSVLLGKMLDEKQQSGRFPTPYLRNTNVQWDRIIIDDIKVMDIEPSELERFTVRPGDLLICEGGQPGRSAVWNGEIAPMGFQKALHRARPRGSNDVRWLQTFLRVAVGLNVFSTEFGQATIGHLTGEQLRSLRLPLPDPAIQGSLSDKLDRDLAELRGVDRSLLRSIALLGELKRSLITAAVTGEFDVSTADGTQVLAGVSS